MWALVPIYSWIYCVSVCMSVCVFSGRIRYNHDTYKHWRHLSYALLKGFSVAQWKSTEHVVPEPRFDSWRESFFNLNFWLTVLIVFSIIHFLRFRRISDRKFYIVRLILSIEPREGDQEASCFSFYLFWIYDIDFMMCHKGIFFPSVYLCSSFSRSAVSCFYTCGSFYFW